MGSPYCAIDFRLSFLCFLFLKQNQTKIESIATATTPLTAPAMIGVVELLDAGGSLLCVAAGVDELVTEAIAPTTSVGAVGVDLIVEVTDDSGVDRGTKVTVTMVCGCFPGDTVIVLIVVTVAEVDDEAELASGQPLRSQGST